MTNLTNNEAVVCRACSPPRVKLNRCIKYTCKAMQGYSMLGADLPPIPKTKPKATDRLTPCRLTIHKS